MSFDARPESHADPTGRAEKICRFVENLQVWEGALAGQPLKLHPFQRAIIRRIYGPSDAEGNRLVRTACLWLPRGNGKTALAAALALAHLMGPEAENGGQIVLAATDRENASIAYRHALRMVEQDAVLASRCHAVESRKQLDHIKTKSVLKAISSEAYSKHGLSVSFFLCDELHAWPPEEGQRLFGTVTASMIKRAHPLTVVISTAGQGTGGLAADLWSYTHRVASGEIDDPSHATIIFAAGPNDDWRDESAWRKANPALEAGFLTIEALRARAKKAEHFPADVADFKRYHLNLWQEGTGEPWLDLQLYDDAEPRTSLAELAGRPCWIGLDLSSVQDLTAVVAIFVDDSASGRKFDVLAQFFLPQTGIEKKSEADRSDYLRWARDGHLTLTPGNVVDYSAIVEFIIGLGMKYSVQEIAVDRWNSTAITTCLQAEDFTVTAFGQGFASMSGPVKELKTAILGRRFRHGGNPVLRMSFANVVTERDAAENEKFHKANARGRIDGAVAAAMAIGRAIAGDPVGSIYATPERAGGLLMI